MSGRLTAPPLGVERLASFLERTIASRGRRPTPSSPTEWQRDVTLLAALGVNLRETLEHVFAASPSLAAFERWLLDKNGGGIERATIARLNAALAESLDTSLSASAEAVLDREALASFDEHGYVVLHDAISAAACDATATAIWEFLGFDPTSPDTWTAPALGATIWVPLLHHPAVDANRRAPRIRAAFEQLWGRSDLWPVIDQVGFNPPETPSWRFPGPHLHWDVSLAPPVPFGLQGLLYLTDTIADQGAFTCVPGFHRRLDAWVASLPSGASPREQDLTKLGPVPVPGRAGDLVVWHQALPHGSSPNRAGRPRMVQYLTLRPTQWDEHAEWR